MSRVAVAQEGSRDGGKRLHPGPGCKRRGALSFLVSPGQRAELPLVRIHGSGDFPALASCKHPLGAELQISSASKQTSAYFIQLHKHGVEEKWERGKEKRNRKSGSVELFSSARRFLHLGEAKGEAPSSRREVVCGGLHSGEST